MTDPTMAEFQRRLIRVEEKTVLREVYDRDIAEIQTDISDIKAGTNRLIGLVISESVALAVAIVIVLLNLFLGGLG